MKHVALLSLLWLLANCSPEKANTIITAYTGATIIDGNGGSPIQNGVMLVSDGKVIGIGPRDTMEIPKGATIIDLSGKFIMPGIINGHGHAGDVKGIEGGHYSIDNLKENLTLYARYGVTTVVSLGGDRVEAEALRAENDSLPERKYARLYIAGAIITGATPAAGDSVVDKNHKMGVDFMKIRVDDNLGTATKVSEDVYREAIRRAHELGYKVATHMYYFDDASKLLDAGTDMMAHSVRDLPVDDAFINRMKEKKVCYCPTLTRELSTFVYGDTASFFSDPFFTKVYGSTVTGPLLDPKRQAQVQESKGAKVYKQQLPVAMANLKKLSDAGVPIVFGTDSGVPTRFMGYFEHLEMAMMAEAGLTPNEIIRSATGGAASCMGLLGVGTLQKGNWADFIVLDADPLVDIRNTRKISKVFIGGREIQ